MTLRRISSTHCVPQPPDPQSPGAKRLGPQRLGAALARALLAAVALSTLTSGSGCHTGESHEEAEHHAPAHRPDAYPAAVERIEVLHAELLDPASPARPEGTVDALQELFDLVRWLPELAADSDLNERSWTQVAESARATETTLQPLFAQAAGERAAAYRRVSDELGGRLAEWRRIKAEFPVPRAAAGGAR